MRNTLKTLLRRVACSDVGWRTIRPLVILAEFSKQERIAHQTRKSEAVDRLDEAALSHHISPDLVVMNGPFRGLRYPELQATGSVSLAKILGSYEQELHNTLQSFRTTEYSQILDVGCAEGYYAVGLAMIFPTARVTAFDIDEKSQILCRLMAAHNRVADRVQVRRELTAQELARIPFTGHSLLLADCEGFEIKLFTPQSVANLGRCDLIIETHDFVDPEISDRIENLLTPTHKVNRIASIDDIQKAKSYEYTELRGLNVKQRHRVVRERRPGTMEWLIARPL